METTVWTGRGMNPQRGSLSLERGRLRFEVGGREIFDAPVAELGIRWPWYSFGCQFWAHAGGRRYFISFLHTLNTFWSWWDGVRRGRRWKRALESNRA